MKKIVIPALFVIVFLNYTSAQNKKEQIEILQNRVDSLAVLNKNLSVQIDSLTHSLSGESEKLQIAKNELSLTKNQLIFLKQKSTSDSLTHLSEKGKLSLQNKSS